MFDFVPQDELLNRAFQLACFIHGDKETALKVLNLSLERLETAVAAQDKRLYYTPSGKHLSRRDRSTGSRYKVCFSESQLLQRLIYLTSEPFEIQQELSDSPSHIGEEDMVIHFMKHLVHIAMKRNSFYVALVMSRVLHTYTTSETIDIYSAVGQPDRMRDEDYYRARKRRIMQEIKQRFGSLVGVCQGPRAEERFIIQDCSGWKAKLVARCLELFVPWDTPCLIPATSATRNISRFYSRHRDPDEEHSIEIDRFHALIHPDCYEKLTRDLGLDHPCSRLQIPSFFLSRNDRGNGNGNGGGSDSMRDRLPSLDQQGLTAIKQHIEERATRRRAASRGLLRVRADGVERAQLDLNRSSTAHIHLNEEANIIEVIADDPSGEVLLATHLLSHNETDSAAQHSQRSIVLEGGQRLSFNISRFEGSAGDRSITVEITYQETNPVRAVFLFSSRCGRKLLDSLSQFWRKFIHSTRAALFVSATDVRD
jgi:hypothetical protein